MMKTRLNSCSTTPGYQLCIQRPTTVSIKKSNCAEKRRKKMVIKGDQGKKGNEGMEYNFKQCKS